MIFPDNQEFKITGRLEDHLIEKILKFFLDYSDFLDELESGELKLVYQIIDNKFLIGWTFKESTTLEDGWLDFPIKFNTHVMAMIIESHLEDNKPTVYEKYESMDGSVQDGFLAQIITKPHRALLSFENYPCFYHK